MVREAYDPASAVVFEQAADRGEVVDLGWGDAGPVSHNVQREYFVHDSGLSCAVGGSRAAQGYVQSNVLERRAHPQPGRGAQAFHGDLHAFGRGQGT